MNVELKHHYGWKKYDVPNAQTLAEAAYQAVRNSHDFLTEENHTHDAGERKINWAGKEHTFCSVRIFRGDGAPEFTGPGWARTDYWFAVQYRDRSLKYSSSAPRVGGCQKTR